MKICAGKLRAFTLLELMVALALLAFLVIATFEPFMMEYQVE